MQPKRPWVLSHRDRRKHLKKSPLRALAAAGIIAVGFCLVAGIYFVGLSNKNAAERDFIEYWAVGQQLTHGANPYDFQAVRRLEDSAGRPHANYLLMMRNPPVAFFLAWPLGLVSPKTGLILWLLALLACLSASIWILWILHGRPDNRFHLLGYLFAPSLACLMAGQLGIFLLLGVVLFLCFHQSRPFLAGAALLPCALKPQLFLPLAVALILWALTRKAYSVLAGFTVTLFATCALSFCLDSHAWSQYSQMMRLGGALNEPVPVLSVSFRFLLDRNAVWLQFVPETAACVWAFWYFWTRRDRWSWTDHGLLLLLVSVMCTPFGWFTDESILLPAVLAGLYRAVDSRRSLVPLALIAGIALIEALAAVQITSPYYLWTTPAWLAWYLYATGRIGASAKSMRIDAGIPDQARSR
jgi:Glycosyltransferase family 87